MGVGQIDICIFNYVYGGAKGNYDLGKEKLVLSIIQVSRYLYVWWTILIAVKQQLMASKYK